MDVILAEYAMVHPDGWRGGAMRRFYHYAGRTPCPELSDGRADTYRSLAPAIPAEQAIEHEETHGALRFFREPGREGEMVYVGVRKENGLGVVEVTLGSRWKSWRDFVRAFENCRADLRSPSNVCYVTTDGRRIALNAGRAFVDDVEVPLDDWPLYDSPFLRAAWFGQADDAGRIVFGQNATGRVVFDFRDASKTNRELSHGKEAQ